MSRKDVFFVAEDKITGFCPECKNKLEIPVDLSEFSCMYCGARLRKEDLLPERKQPEAVPAGDAEACLLAGIQKLADGITNYPRAVQNLTRGGYVPFFERYEEENREAAEQIGLAAGDLGAEEAARRAAEGFLREIARRLSGKRGKPSAGDLEDAKFTLCLFLIPMVRKAELEISEPLARELHDQWLEAYPKLPFSLTSYEQILEGFKRKRLCFITTAVCESFQKPDDCPELTAFRAFRDGYLRSCPDGEELIREYYDVAPGIVLAIRTAGESGEFDRIWSEYLAPCYAAIGAGENEACKKTYTQMVQELKKKYLKM